MILKEQCILLNIKTTQKEKFTLINVDATTNSCALSDISVNPTNSLV
jgi:hypothetical protein